MTIKIGTKKAVITLVGTMSAMLEKVAGMLFLPALPAMALSLHISVKLGQIAFSTYLLGLFIAQLISGYISDTWGEKKGLVLLSAIYVIGTLLSAMVNQYPFVFAGLFIQGFGIGGIFPISQALISRTYTTKKTAKAFAHIGIFTAGSLALTPIAGAYLVHHFGWQSVFLFLTLFSMCIGSLYFLLPRDTHNKNYKMTSNGILKNYISVYGKFHYIKYTINIALLNAVCYVFYTISPFLIIKDYHFSEKKYASYLLLPIFGLIFGRLCSAFLTDFYVQSKIIQLGNIVMLAGAIGLIFISNSYYNSVMMIMIFITICFLGVGIASPSSRAKAIHTAVYFVGTAAALLSATVNVIGSLNSTIAAHIEDIYMSRFILIISVINIIWFTLMNLKKEQE